MQALIICKHHNNPYQNQRRCKHNDLAYSMPCTATLPVFMTSTPDPVPLVVMAPAPVAFSMLQSAHDPVTTPCHEYAVLKGEPVRKVSSVVFPPPE
jgi:hypothetical protein